MATAKWLPGEEEAFMSHTLGAFTDLVKERGAAAVIVALDDDILLEFYNELEKVYG